MDIRKALPVLACLLFLAFQGVAFRRLVDDPTSFWLTRPHQDALMDYAPHQGPESAMAGDWTLLLKAPRASRGEVRMYARQGLQRVTAARDAYGALLEPLTPAQRAAFQVPQADLVDPLFPGVDATSQSIFFYCVGALVERAGTATATSGAEKAAAPGAVEMMPEALFWRLGRLAVSPSSSLTPEQSAQVLGGFRRLARCLDDYQAVRGRLWTLSGLAARQRQEGEAPPFPFPTPQELRSAEKVLVTLGGR